MFNPIISKSIKYISYDELIYHKFISNQILNGDISYKKQDYKVIYLENVNTFRVYRIFDIKNTSNKFIPDIYDFYVKDVEIFGYTKIEFNQGFYYINYNLSDNIKRLVFNDIDQYIDNKIEIYNDDLTKLFIEDYNKYFDFIYKNKEEYEINIQQLFVIYPYLYYNKDKDLIFPELNKKIIFEPYKIFKIKKIINL